MTGFNGASTALLAGSITCSDMGGAFHGCVSSIDSGCDVSLNLVVY